MRSADTLASSPDQFGGVIVDSEQLPADVAEFEASLTHSLQTWTSAGHRLVWLDVPLARGALVPGAAAGGFFFHHSNESDGMMVRRLVDGAVIPTHATHYIGGGGGGVNERQEVRGLGGGRRP